MDMFVCLQICIYVCINTHISLPYIYLLMMHKLNTQVCTRVPVYARPIQLIHEKQVHTDTSFIFSALIVE